MIGKVPNSLGNQNYDKLQMKINPSRKGNNPLFMFIVYPKMKKNPTVSSIARVTFVIK